MDTPRPPALDYVFGLEKLGIKFGLDNIRAICSALGDPHLASSSVIIAGTNGKGSVAAMVDAALRAAGVRTGLYTSPHLVRLEERFAIDGRAVGTAEMAEAAATVRDAVRRLRSDGRLATDPTFFEVTTAMAFELFRAGGVAFTVLEVGLGGRFDATNVACPVAGAITTIDLDHEQLLGRTIAAIAGEKAGIVKPGMDLVVGETKPEALEVIAAACRERGAVLVAAWDGVRSRAQALEDGRFSVDLETPRRRYPTMAVSLRGRHQVANAIIAVRLLEVLEERQALAGLDAAAVARGIGAARWPGRLDLRVDSQGRRVLCDGAHNPAGARVLADYLAEFHPGGLPIVFGIMRDKDVAGTLAPLLPFAAPLILTAARADRALPAEALETAARQLGARETRRAADPAGALALAWSRSSLACVAGSLFLVGDVLGDLDRPAPPTDTGTC